jgi:hypothetical protein
MINDIAYVMNSLTDRGLVEEAKSLHPIFRKFAWDVFERTKKLLNLANPEKNNQALERLSSTRALYKLWKGSGGLGAAPALSDDMLADAIAETNSYGFANEGFLGGLFSHAELEIIRNALEAKSRGEAYSPFEPEGPEGTTGSSVYSESEIKSRMENIEYVIQSMLKQQLDSGRLTDFFVKIDRTRGRSDAYVASVLGQWVTFIVPVTEGKLGVKALSFRDLAESSFLEDNFLGKR